METETLGNGAAETPGTVSLDDDLNYMDAVSTSFVSVSVVGAVKPEDLLPTWAYYTVIFAYLIAVIFASIFIDDLTLIFGIIAGLAECTTVFILPSIFYLVACNTERKEEEAYLRAVRQGTRLARRLRSR